jgi:hypothetical protein
MALTLVVDVLARRVTRNSTTQLQRETDEIQEESRREREMSNKLAELRKKAKAGDEQAAREAETLKKRRDEMLQKRVEDARKQLEQILGKSKGESERPLTNIERLARWMHASGQWSLFQQCLQTVILAFFIRALCPGLGVKDMAFRCPRVAGMAVLTLTLLLLSQFVATKSLLATRVIFWVLYVLGIIAYIWLGLLIVEACERIGEHVERIQKKPAQVEET